MIVAFASCGSADQTAEQDQGQEQAATESKAKAQGEKSDGGSDALVVYFSRTGEQYEVGKIDKGNTAIVADMIIIVKIPRHRAFITVCGILMLIGEMKK